MTEPIRAFTAEHLKVQVYSDRGALGKAAAEQAIERIRQLQWEKGSLRMIFAAAPSQNEFLAALAAAEGIDWSAITVFHMDEYIGLPPGAPQAFSRFVCEKLFDQVKPGEVHLIDSTGSAEAECARYAALLQEKPIDIVCLGIGENGHIAFNDPPVADFQDPQWVKPVKLDLACRQQQVNDGCFPDLASVPTHALTLTIPALMSGSHLFCMVPGPTKRAAVTATITGPVGTACPATALRSHPDCTLYVDRDSCEYERWL
ncbi:glucosamine-6-phosphate deaminase [Paenibacillus cremeus]|uniref:Glucosamine-6-phosphate deaminase n=1 Tax=Paenibacillus cremeus TaxID=2163881 RepID=A0A559K7K6_9BACL|nr:glucosamine-6-phosphate deaminase [Paenibacillus cremeus]TVY08115.1 glucosamine-6-phosphate deaminase [Paenibacillus cremeus]